MAPHAIIQQMKPETAARFFAELEGKDANLVKTTLMVLAKQRKLRPVFIERKSKAERLLWLRDMLGRRINDATAAHLLQVWFVGCHADMLCAFLDSLGIAHDDDGTVSELPPPPDAERLRAAADALLEKYDPDLVGTYFRTFQSLDENGGWPALETLLAEHPAFAPASEAA